PVDLDLAPLNGQDPRGHGNIRAAFPQVHDADRGRLPDVRLAHARLVLGQGRRRLFRNSRAAAEVHLDLTAVLLRVRVLHADDVSLGDGDRQRVPRGEGDRRRRIAEEAVQDSLRASFDGPGGSAVSRGSARWPKVLRMGTEDSFRGLPWRMPWIPTRCSMPRSTSSISGGSRRLRRSQGHGARSTWTNGSPSSMRRTWGGWRLFPKTVRRRLSRIWERRSAERGSP